MRKLYRKYYTPEQLYNERWKNIFPGISVKIIEHLAAVGEIDAEIDEWDIITIFPDAILRYEAEQADADEQMSPPLYLDPNHEFYSKELAMGIKAWNEIFGNGKIKKNRSYKDQIKAALAGKGLSNAAVERIATVVNPNKEGGAPVTE